MRNKRFINNNKKSFEMDFTPLIDIVFLLLIFFMVGTTVNNMSNMKIELPKTSGLVGTKLVKNLRVLVDKEKKIIVQYELENKDFEKELSQKEITGFIGDLLSKNENKNVSLVADKGLDYGYIVALMEDIKRAGAQGLNIETEGEK